MGGNDGQMEIKKTLDETLLNPESALIEYVASILLAEKRNRAVPPYLKTPLEIPIPSLPW
jgi:hypothetical protein